jgi:hypothetical protein
LTLLKASLSELSIARQLLKSSESFSCCVNVQVNSRIAEVEEDGTVRTSRALICRSNAAARLDVIERIWLKDLEAIVRNSSAERTEVHSYSAFDVVEVDEMSGGGGGET